VASQALPAENVDDTRAQHPPAQEGFDHEHEQLHVFDAQLQLCAPVDV
jgi:hypothetical protein